MSKCKVENRSSGPTFWAPKIKRRKNKKIETRPVKTSYKMAVSWLYSQYRRSCMTSVQSRSPTPTQPLEFFLLLKFTPQFFGSNTCKDTTGLVFINCTKL